MEKPPVMRTIKPTRSLNAYNFFFQKERERLLAVLPENFSCKPRNGGHGKISFQDLARVVSANWREISAEYKAQCVELARLDRIRYETELEQWKETTKYLHKIERDSMPDPRELAKKKKTHAGTTAHKISSIQPVVPAGSIGPSCIMYGEDTVHAVVMGFEIHQLEPIPWQPEPYIPRPERDRLIDVSRLAAKLDKKSRDFLIKALL